MPDDPPPLIKGLGNGATFPPDGRGRGMIEGRLRISDGEGGERTVTGLEEFNMVGPPAADVWGGKRGPTEYHFCGRLETDARHLGKLLTGETVAIEIQGLCMPYNVEHAIIYSVSFGMDPQRYEIQAYDAEEGGQGMSVRGVTPLDDLIQEAREMQAQGRYINGTIFHAMADEIDRLRAERQRIVEALRQEADAFADRLEATGTTSEPEVK